MFVNFFSQKVIYLIHSFEQSWICGFNSDHYNWYLYNKNFQQLWRQKNSANEEKSSNEVKTKQKTPSYTRLTGSL